MGSTNNICHPGLLQKYKGPQASPRERPLDVRKVKEMGSSFDLPQGGHPCDQPDCNWVTSLLDLCARQLSWVWVLSVTCICIPTQIPRSSPKPLCSFWRFSFVHCSILLWYQKSYNVSRDPQCVLQPWYIHQGTSQLLIYIFCERHVYPLLVCSSFWHRPYSRKNDVP